MYVFRCGVLSFLLSESLVSGFTTGAAMHVFTSQVKDLLGVQIKRNDGTFELIKVRRSGL
jgi:solute carrier family 26, other